ncbi:MAG: hypothetical protein JNM52_05605, partial [Betaproteobacteria bacterium]|nr:hypothetical protein [Betaproteobacteria bacterium]
MKHLQRIGYSPNRSDIKQRIPHKPSWLGCITYIALLLGCPPALAQAAAIVKQPQGTLVVVEEDLSVKVRGGWVK